MHSFQDFYAWVERIRTLEKMPPSGTPPLHRMTALARALCNPHNAYQSIHVAGTKGKGSSARMLAAILNEIGFNTGLYASPHVMDPRERITRAGVFFSPAEYASACTHVYHTVKKTENLRDYGQATWFELITLLAFMLFAQQRMEWSVFEVGLGGRLDATNIICPSICLLLPIEQEHTRILGTRIKSIAKEKGGIIKPYTPIFCFDQPEDALHVFKHIAREKHAPFFYLPDMVTHIESSIKHFTHTATLSFNAAHPVGRLFARNIHCTLALCDIVQAKNAALAACAAKYLFPTVSETLIERGLSRAYVPARFEIMQEDPLIVIDGAHTTQSIRCACRTFSSLLPSAQYILLFACAADKAVSQFPPLFSHAASEIFLTIPGTSKHADIQKTYHAFRTTFHQTVPIFWSEDFASIISRALYASFAQRKALLAIGSFYLAAEVKRIYARTCHTLPNR
ncbi:folylpolyglutamate synthetase [Treponema pallidum subsp. pallidum str. Sea 81-4]|nr:folylpolyglutamate synthase/dihydrofolate synthase family protein [Treponema pallidum]AHN67023.1 folylpolyglutamate synthetase [Treponema pallidum subsp. pallidum str. Sea 81-4]UZQ71692.1 bifunctional folylpolyglutamate synthase/dihydrofolate synthase [Treponema pallidum]UZV93594.1 bifunctional folylpolyglutamate synthase/dihydrofolate synthase [Treponema pallidum]WBG16273.1 bifunctional folylpolyglutamate synthase/dihydrofolate synthase [Treponema pallidum]WGV76443.1 folylpolyglutamate syn